VNSTLDLIENRRSVRVYADTPLTQGEKDAILHAAMRAPTAGNMMLYTIIEVEEPALKEKLAETCDHQPFIAKAPYLLLFLADYQRWLDYYQISGVEERCRELGRTPRNPGVGDLLLACCDALIAAQNAVLAAESIGIGSCYIGDILENYEIHRELFILPRYTLPITLLCFGHPRTEAGQKRKTTRFEKQFVVHPNHYRRLSASELLEMFAENEALDGGHFIDGAKNFGQHTYFRKFIADFSFEMNRSVAEMIRNWR